MTTQLLKMSFLIKHPSSKRFQLQKELNFLPYKKKT